MARGNLAARAVKCAGEALHQIAPLGERPLARRMDLDEDRFCDRRLVGAELEQLGHPRAQPLAPGRLPFGGAEQPLVEPLAGVAVSLREAVLSVLEVLVEGRPAGPGPLDHVLDRDLLVAHLAADQQDRLQQALPRRSRAQPREGNDGSDLLVFVDALGVSGIRSYQFCKRDLLSRYSSFQKR